MLILLLFIYFVLVMLFRPDSRIMQTQMCLQFCKSFIKEYGQIGDNDNLTTDLIKIDKTQNLFSVMTNFQLFQTCVAKWWVIVPQIAQNWIIAFFATI